MSKSAEIGLPKGISVADAYVAGVSDGESRILTKLEQFAQDPEGFGRPSDRLWDSLIEYLKELRND